MDPVLVGILGVIVLTILIFLGLPIVFSAAFVGLSGTFYLAGYDAAAGLAGFLPFEAMSKYSFSVIPLFLIMGMLAYYGGVTDELYETSQKIFGHLPGGLAIATAMASAMFAAASGASTASAAVMSRVALPIMRQAGVDRGLSVGVIAASGTLASLIPPSGLIVIYGLITEQSIGKLLIGGIIPGIISVVIYAGMIYFRCMINPDLHPRQPKYPLSVRLKSIKGIWGAALIFLVIVVGIYTGIFTPVEAAGVGSIAALFIAVVSGRFKWKMVSKSIEQMGVTSVMLLFNLAGIYLFVRFMAISDSPGILAEWVGLLGINRYFILAGFLSIYVVLGMAMSALAMMILTVPVVLPSIIMMGWDPIWFGIVVIKMCEIALVSPPVGMNVYVVNSVNPDFSVYEIFKGIMPFLAMDFLTLIVLIIFPCLVTWLPSLM